MLKRSLSLLKSVPKKIQFLLMAGVLSATVLPIHHYLGRAENVPSSALLGEVTSRANIEELPHEIGTLPPSAFVVPPWKKPLGMKFWPGIRQPPTQSAEEADLEDDVEVIGVQLAGRARAYCIDALSDGPRFHVVNDVLADTPVTVAYCDMTRHARVFTSTMGSAPLAIGVGGWNATKGLMLYYEGVHYALEDGTNLSQPQGQSLPFQRMDRERTTWGEWRRVHPSTDVYVSPPTEQSAREKDYWPGIRQPPTQAAEEADLQEDAEVIGVCIGGRARAYCVASLSGEPEFHVVNDVLAGRPVTVAYCDITRCTRVLTTAKGQAPLDVHVGGWDDEQGMMLYIGGINYALQDGKNITHPEASPLPYQQMKHERMTWGQWRRAHPDTDVYVISPCST